MPNTTFDPDWLLKALDSKNEKERADAMRQARSLPPDALLALSRREAEHFRSYTRRNRLQAVLLAVLLYMPLFAYSYITHARPFLYLLWITTIVNLSVIVPSVNIYSNGYKPSRARRSLADVLNEADDVCFVPVALTLLQAKTADITPSLMALLRRLLPRLRVGNAQNWTPEQYRMLLALLDNAKLSSLGVKQEGELRVCVLKALEQIGDARAVPVVQALAEASPKRTPPAVRQAAAECLPFLMQRVGERQQAQTLLRSSFASSAGGDSLLRPSVGADAQTPDEQLLRPRM